jgi:CRP-like cAMP-binding protein
MPPINTIDDARQNLLLGALPESEFERIAPMLEPIELEAGQILWEAEADSRYIYFPTTALICLLYDSDTGASVEVGMVGKQGIVGVWTFMTEARMATRAVTYTTGVAYRMSASDAKTEFDRCGDFNGVILAFTQILIAHIAQGAMCNQLHSVDHRLCRFLLLMHDHLDSSLILLTHEQIAQALGVRRETVSLSARSLQDRGLIRYVRGRIRVLDREALERFTCECYQSDIKHYQRVLKNFMAERG